MNLNNFSISKKLLLIQIIPFIGLLLFSTYEMAGKANQYFEMKNVGELAKFSTRVSLFVHEMQKERGRSAVYLGSSGEKYASELKTQRIKTDKSFQTLDSFIQNLGISKYESDFEKKLNNILDNLANLKNIRSQVNDRTISSSEAIDYYSSINEKLLNLLGKISSLSNDSAISNINTGYVNFLKGKERAGIERAVVSHAFATNKISPADYHTFRRLNTERKVFFDNFLSIVPQSEIDLYEMKTKLPIVTELKRMRDIINEKKTDGEFQTDASHWFETATKRIDDLKEIDDFIASDLLKEAIKREVKARNTLILFALLTITMILASLFIGRAISKKFTDSLTQLQSVMMTAGRDSDLTLRADVKGRDEIAQMGEAFNKMLQNFSSMLNKINISSHELRSSAIELSKISKDSTQAIMQQLEETEQIATASTQMSASVNEVAQNANEASNATCNADEQANSGNCLVVNVTSSINSLVAEVERTTGIIHELEEGSINIGIVLDVIRSIAEQTNLLALNAAIEAARAGEQGRGFAVVADEVRNLASRTQESTDEIQTMIEQLQQDTRSAVKAMQQGGAQAKSSSDLANQATSAINEITTAVSRISEMNVQIANAAVEQSTVAEEISRKIVSISTISHQASDGAQQTAVASAQMADLATELEHAVSVFKT